MFTVGGYYSTKEDLNHLLAKDILLMIYQVNIKVLLLVILFLVACKQQKELRIIPLSPYEQTVGYTEDDRTREFTFAIDNFKYTKANMQILDSMVLKKLPKEYLKKDRGILFLFYKYEPSKIDENFIHREEPKQSNLFMEAGAELLVKYQWVHGRFIAVYIYRNNSVKTEERNW